MYDKYQLLKFIELYYSEEYSSRISPIKTHKTLYFLYAYWPRFQQSINEINTGGKKKTHSISLLINDVEFQAWQYGPVEKDIYHKIMKGKEIENRKINHLEEIYIKEMCKEIFKYQDFKLVEISHEDISWKSNYSIDDRFHNKKISDKSLIQEYINAKEKYFDSVLSKLSNCFIDDKKSKYLK